MLKVPTIIINRCCKMSLKVCYRDFHPKICSFRLVRKFFWRNGFVMCAAIDRTYCWKKHLFVWVCKPGATKIRKKNSESFKFIASELNVVNLKFITPSNPEVDDTDVLPRTKRCLPTSVSTPERNPGRRKFRKSTKVRRRRRGKAVQENR